MMPNKGKSRREKNPNSRPSSKIAKRSKRSNSRLFEKQSQNLKHFLSKYSLKNKGKTGSGKKSKVGGVSSTISKRRSKHSHSEIY